MRADLSDSIAAIEWGRSQLPVLARRLRAWEAMNVELVPVDLNPPHGKLAAVAREKEPLPAIFHAEVGAIIGSFRSALDLLGATLARRNGISPSKDTHFPIFASHQDMLDPLHGIERKKWLSRAEVHLIKSLNPYEGGNDLLWSLHQLDICRKHERLVACMINPVLEFVVGARVGFPEGMRPRLHDLKDEPVLFVYPRDTPKPDAQITVQVVFNEIYLPVYRHKLFETLVAFARGVTDIINLFNSP